MFLWRISQARCRQQRALQCTGQVIWNNSYKLKKKQASHGYTDVDTTAPQHLQQRTQLETGSFVVIRTWYWEARAGWHGDGDGWLLLLCWLRLSANECHCIALDPIFVQSMIYTLKAQSLLWSSGKGSGKGRLVKVTIKRSLKATCGIFHIFLWVP